MLLFIKQKEGIVKTLLFLLVSSFLSASIIAQTLTLRFEGSSSTNYEVKIDGKSYFSSNIAADNNSSYNQRLLKVENLSPGSHNLEVYNAGTDATVNNNNEPVYTNTFQLRVGYDMVIAIRRNGQVTFTEKRSTGSTNTQVNTPMTDANFDKLMQSVNSKWSQSAKLTTIKTALNNKANYFTIEQVGQMLSVITSERSRIDLAKLSYARVTDPENFNEIYSLLNSQAGKTELENYVKAKSTSSTVATNNTYNGRTPMTNYNYNQLVTMVKNQYRQEGKVAVITDAFNTTTDYFTVAQLRQLITLVTAENDRLLLLKLAYPRVADQANFMQLNTLLGKQASKDDLNYFVKNGGITVPAEQYSTRVAISDAEFRQIHQKAALHFRQSSVVRDVREAFNSTVNYYSIPQIRTLLQMISLESDRVALAKLAYHRVTDPNNYSQLYDLFTLESSKTELANYINSVARNR